MQAQFMRTMGGGIAAFCCATLILVSTAVAAPYAAMVMDARNGEVLHARNHDTKLHPASLTKMMTLYIAFEAVKHGEVGLDTKFTTSRRATRAECVCLGLREGQKISLRYLIRAAALRSANDAAVVIAEGISGSVEAFAERMTRTARAMGMRNTTFKNPHGLTQSGHVSTARDMTILGRQLYFDYPQYFNIFSRRSDYAGVATVPNTNRRFLDAYRGADGIKTGYTRAAGFNLTASAKRGSKHIITTMFGGSSTAARNARVAELMDMGFSRAKSRVAERAPSRPAYQGKSRVAGTPRNGDDDPNAGAKTIRLVTAVRKSLRPKARPAEPLPETLLVAVAEGVDISVAETAEELNLAALAPDSVDVTPPPRPDPEPDATALAAAEAAGFTVADPADLASLKATNPTDGAAPEATATTPSPDTIASQIAQAIETATDGAPDRPDTVEQAVTDLSNNGDPVQVAETAQATTPQTPAAPAQDSGPPADALWTGAPESFLPEPKETAVSLGTDLNATLPISSNAGTGDIILTRADDPDEELATALVAESFNDGGRQVISSVSSSDAGRLWGISIGAFNTRHDAERSLITVKMAEAQALSSGLSRIRQRAGQFEASFAGLTKLEARQACLRLAARGMDCFVDQP